MKHVIFTILFDLLFLVIYCLGLYVGTQDMAKVFRHAKWFAFGCLIGEILILMVQHLANYFHGSSITPYLLLMG